MIRFLLRTLGLWLLAAAFIFVVYDGMRSIAGNVLVLTRVADFWSNVHQASLLGLQPLLENYASWLWNPVMVTFLAQPVALVFAIVAIILVVLGRKKKPLIGYSRR